MKPQKRKKTQLSKPILKKNKAEGIALILTYTANL